MIRNSLALILFLLLTGCAYRRIDFNHYLLRSDVILSEEQERAIVSKARLGWSDDGRIRVLYLKGTPYERGYQQGKLLRREVQDNIGYIYERAVKKFHSRELFAEVYERMRPFIPQDYIEEMHGLAHGSRLPLETIHHVHVLADLGEWGGKKRAKEILRKMMAGDIGTSCSNLSVRGSATQDSELYVARILDWGLHRISRLHRYPLITITRPEKGVPSANIGWVGYLGAISGINAEGITLGEMGYGDPPGETLRGTPMPFLLRDVLTHARNLADVERIIREIPGTNSYIFLMSDGKTGESSLFVRDRSRLRTFGPNTEITDRKEHLPAVTDTLYGGRYNEKMTALLRRHHGSLAPTLLMETIIPQIVMSSNFQNVVYRPRARQFWVSNAKDRRTFAANQPYTFFDLDQALQTFP